MADQSSGRKLFQSREEFVSMFLGLAIVLVVFFLVFNYFGSKKKGNVDIPGVSDTAIVDKNSPLTINQATIIPTKTKNVVTAAPTVVVAEPIKVGVANLSSTDKKIYVVKKGDSLWKIAVQEYGSGYKWVEIKKENNLSKPGLLAVGQNLVLPVIGNGQQTITGDAYVVVKGDHLSKIALLAYGDSFAWTKIYEANRNLIKNPNIIRTGWKLVIPR